MDLKKTDDLDINNLISFLDIDKSIQQYQKIDWSKLLRKDLGEYSLEITKANLDRIKSIFDEIVNYPNLHQLSDEFKKQIKEMIDSLLQFADDVINKFRDTSERKKWIKRVKDAEFTIYRDLFHIYSFIKNFDPGRDEKFKDVIEKSEERIKKLNEYLLKAENLLQEVQKKAVQGEIINYGNIFGGEATKNKDAAQNNRWFMFGSVAITAIISIILFQNTKFISSENLTFLENILQIIKTQNIFFKFVLLSLGGYLIAHFSKMHYTEKNLYNLNIQRQNAINSHKQILDSVIATKSENEKEIRNAILLELTRAIFENHETGYLKGSKNNPSPSNQVIEITKSITK